MLGLEKSVESVVWVFGGGVEWFVVRKTQQDRGGDLDLGSEWRKGNSEKELVSD